MSDLAPASDPPEPALAATLEYGRAGDASAFGKLVRGIALLLAIFGAVACYLYAAEAYRWYKSTPPTMFPPDNLDRASLNQVMACAAAAKCLGELLMCVGGFGILFRRRAAAWIVCGGALCLLAGVLISPLGFAIIATGFAGTLMWENVRTLALDCLASAPDALLPLVLLWLFSRGLIRDAIGVK